MSSRTVAAARRRGRIAQAAAVITLSLGAAALVGATAGNAATATPLSNPSLETADSKGVPTCWQTNGWGTNKATFSRTTAAHTGSWAEKVVVSSYSSGAQRLVVGMNSCAPAVASGHSYALSGYYQMNGKAAVVTFYLSKSTNKWVYWETGPVLAQTSAWAPTTFTTSPAPSDAARLSFGISLQSNGTLNVDDFSAVDTSASSPTSSSPSPSPSPSPTTSSTTSSPAPSPSPTTSTSSTTSSPAPSPSTSSTTSSPSPSPSPTTSTGATWYVSRTGSNADGTSWSSAWSELANINWSVVKPGDTILIDGGSTSCGSDYGFATTRPGLSCGMLYTTPLTVKANGTSTADVTIRLASDAGRNGTAVVFGGRSTPLPYCDQSSYSASGTARAAGITIPGYSHITIDGGHRSGIMVYGAQSGVDLASDSTSFVTLRNLELFDNGTFSTWSYGYKSDGEGVSLVGHDITIDRSLIHDNGQDAIQDRYTGTINNNSHAAMSNISVTNSWLYEHRESPLFPGYGFNAGSQNIASQNCTHVDGLQVWGGGLHQKNMTFDHDIMGPFLAQGVYPGDQDLASFDNVVVTNTLFLNVLDHAIIGDSIASDSTTPGKWQIRNVTSYMTNSPNTGLSSHGKVDLAGSGHAVSNSIFYNGYFATDSAFSSASGNVWSGGDPVLGGVQQNPGFAGPLPTTNSPSFATLTALDLTPSCSACGSSGSSIHKVADLTARIDTLDQTP